MIEKRLGKISEVDFGIGGHNDACVGISLHFSGDGWGTRKFIGDWFIPVDEFCMWTDEERLMNLGKICIDLVEILKKAKCYSVAQLLNKPVEVSIENGTLKEWRILTEVL